MSQWTEHFRPTLVAISKVSGDTYRQVDGDQVLAELRSMGHESDRVTFKNVMRALRDGGYVDFTTTSYGPTLIQLDLAGRQEVEGWPRAGSITELTSIPS